MGENGAGCSPGATGLLIVLSPRRMELNEVREDRSRKTYDNTQFAASARTHPAAAALSNPGSRARLTSWRVVSRRRRRRCVLLLTSCPPNLP